MRVCIICEGSYPYVSGGVAGWVNMLISEYKDVEFVIWSIATNRQEMHQYKYAIPENVADIRTFYISEQKLDGSYKKIKLSLEERKILKNLLVDDLDEINWKSCLLLMKKHQKNLVNILMGEDFYNIALELYSREFSKTSFNEYLWSLRGMYFPFMKILSEDLIKADIYHAVSTGYAGILGSIASNINNKPLLLSEHGIYTREREEDIIRSNWLKGSFKELWINFFKKLSLITYNQASLVTTLFEMNKTLQIELGCPESKIEIIPNGVNYDEYQDLKPRSDMSKQYYNIGAILRIVPIKDIKTMLLAFSTVKKNLPHARLNILGNYDENPDYYYECTKLIKALSIEDVVFYGQVNVKEYINDFDLLLLTSISEGQPLSVLEGMAVGVPYICTNVGDCRNLIEGFKDDRLGKAGFIVPIMDTQALAERILYSANNPERMKKMGQSGKERVKRYYQKSFFINRFKEIYQELGESNIWQESVSN